jgi:hypothetical protein
VDAEAGSGPLIAGRALLAAMTLLLVVAIHRDLGAIDPCALIVSCIKALSAF